MTHAYYPTYHIKLPLYTLLKDIDGVERIDDQVDVVSSSDGLFEE